MQQIISGVKSGRYVAGQRLIESELQELTGVSRGPIREAIRRLAAEGLLETPHQKGARLRRLTRDELEKLYDVREVVEGLAARYAALHVSQNRYREELENLDAAFRQRYDGSPQSFMAYNEAFHRLVARMSDNIFLGRVATQLDVPLLALRIQAMIKLVSVDAAHQQHLEIARALLQGDGPGAERAMRRHIRFTKRSILEAQAIFDR